MNVAVFGGFICIAIVLFACGDNLPPVCGDGVLHADEECDDGNLNDGDRCPSTCQGARCGDGFVRAFVEECDDGAANSDSTPDACRSNCRMPTCGDGVKDLAEGCDDGNARNDDACLDTCVSATCGDGSVQAGVEDCDDGARNSDTEPDACRSNCRQARCGDAVRDTDEACDDGNNANDDSCLTTCARGTCGDGFVNLGVEECDAGTLNSDTLANACRSNCERAHCGDLVRDDGEECDDGNASNTDACALCLFATCGDGFVQTSVEQCDDGNIFPDDGCAGCVTARCGDGHVRDGFEECDDGVSNSSTLPDRCRASCRLPNCGDGVVDAGEACDSAGQSTNACDTDCSAPRCGDGLTNVAVGETCDDGNSDAGDGCSACAIEAGWVIYVNAAATGANNGSSWPDAFRSLQDALAVATRGEIWIARGIYHPDEGNGLTLDDRNATFTLKSNVALFGGFAGTEIARSQRDVTSAASSNPTSLDGLINNTNIFSPIRSQNIVTAIGVTGARLDTIKIEEAGGTNGAAIRANGASLIIANSMVSRNTSDAQLTLEDQRGGAMQAIASSIRIERTLFANNILAASTISDEVKSRGGAIYMEGGELEIHDSTFSQNSVHDLMTEGGAIFSRDADLLISKTRFFGNTVACGARPHARGGAIYIDNSTSTTQRLAVIHNSTFDTNIAHSPFLECDGGAIFAAAGTNLVLANDLFIHNTAIDHPCRGGAIFTAAMSSVAVRNCTFVDNSVGSLNDGRASGGAIFADDGSTLSVASSVFWKNRTNEHEVNVVDDDIQSSQQATTSVTFSCMQTTGWGTGAQQLTSSPFDTAANATDFRLRSASTCIDAGDNTAAASDRFDVDRDGNTSEPAPLDFLNRPRFVDYPTSDAGSGSAPLSDCGAFEKPRP